MKDITKDFTVERTGKVYPIFRRVTVEERGVANPYLSTQDEYILRAELGVLFQANKDTYDLALRDARRSLYHKVYAPLWGLLHELYEHVYDGDTRKANDIMDRMRSAMLGEPS